MWVFLEDLMMDKNTHIKSIQGRWCHRGHGAPAMSRHVYHVSVGIIFFIHALVVTYYGAQILGVKTWQRYLPILLRPAWRFAVLPPHKTIPTSPRLPISRRNSQPCDHQPTVEAGEVMLLLPAWSQTDSFIHTAFTSADSGWIIPRDVHHHPREQASKIRFLSVPHF